MLFEYLINRHKRLSKRGVWVQGSPEGRTAPTPQGGVRSCLVLDVNHHNANEIPIDEEATEALARVIAWSGKVWHGKQCDEGCSVARRRYLKDPEHHGTWGMCLLHEWIDADPQSINQYDDYQSICINFNDSRSTKKQMVLDVILNAALNEADARTVVLDYTVHNVGSVFESKQLVKV